MKFFNRKKRQLVYLIEHANWSIKWDGHYITKNLPTSLSPLLSTNHNRLKNKIIHYGSKNLFFQETGYSVPHSSNKTVVTWFHVTPGDKTIDLISNAMQHIDILHTSCTITSDILIKHGAIKEKMVVIPLGVDTEAFKAPTEDEYHNIRRRLGISKDKICIGSFQKDGVGWDEGFEPKMVKGPDILCDVLKELNEEFQIHVLLTGPARGYVKQKLKQLKIPFTHYFLNEYLDIVDFYKALDLYIVSSRAEGGPKALLEAMACGVPLVTTNVGMANDIIENETNGFIVKKNSAEDLIDISRMIIKNTNKEQYRMNASASAKKYDWRIIANRYYNEIYSQLMD